MINIFQPLLGERELAAISEVFASNWLGKGPRTAAFEAAFAAHLDVEPRNVIAVNSCTSALFVSMEVLGVGVGDDVVLPTISFVGAANAVAVTGARPVFCDVDPRTLNPRREDVEKALTERTKAVIVLHYGGYPGEIAEIAQLCRERGLKLVEDAACAVASRVDGTACGTFGDIATWSFDAMKILVTGDGGMLYVRDPELAERARGQIYHGMRQGNGFANAKSGTASRWWEFEVDTFARRSISNDMASAIGLVQLDRLPEFVRRRKEIAAYYDRELADVEGLRCPPLLPAGHESSHYFYWIQLEPEVRDAVAADLLNAGIYTTFRYAPLHKVSAYGADVELPAADAATDRTLCLPLHQAITDDEAQTVVTQLRKSVADHTRV